MTTAWAARHGLTSAEYQTQFDQFASQGYRLTDVSGYSNNGQPRYAAIWEQTIGPAWAARHGLTSAEYQAEFDLQVANGYRLRHISGYAVNDVAHYAAVWEKSGGPAWAARHGMTTAEYQAQFDEYVAQGYRLRHVSGYEVDGEAYYAAIWEKTAGPTWVARHGMTSAEYQAQFDQFASQGYRLTEVNGYTIGDEARYAAIWEMSAGPAWVARHGMSASDYQREFTSLFYQGYRLKWVSGFFVAGTQRYAAIWHSEGLTPSDRALIASKIQAYTTKHAIPGLSIAISKQERLVFAKGYGHTDATAGEAVIPTNLFRIASVSKPITAVSIMRLVESGHPNLLDQHVFGAGAILGTQFGSKPYSAAVQAITVRHLLQHTSGWSNNPNDPMFANPSMNQAQLIGWVLDTRPLANTPGLVYEYLNFGFCVLGRVIEKLSGLSYETFVKTEVLAKCGISRMQIGGSTFAERRADEVAYFGGGAYNLNPPRMDAHGGWIASTVDLVRFMARTDGFTAKTDILQAGDEATMFTGSAAKPGYGLGWAIGNGIRAHNGAMPGTLGLLVRRDDGFSYAALANTRPAGDAFAGELQGVLDDIIASVTNWPATYDLF